MPGAVEGRGGRGQLDGRKQAAPTGGEDRQDPVLAGHGQDIAEDASHRTRTRSAGLRKERPPRSYLLPAAVTTELGSSVLHSRPSLEQRSWLSLEPATTDTSFSTSRTTDGSMLT